MDRRKIIAGLCIISSVIAAGFVRYDSNYPIEKIAQQLDTWKSNYPFEKVYLQFDKPYYAVGDDIWFKAYVTVGGKHKLSALSGVLNVELIDDRDSVKQHLKLPLESGLTWGDLTLSDTLSAGNYRVRAYTNWMRNAGEDYFFDKHITIVNAVNDKVFTNTSYTYTTQNGQQKINALITYTGLNGTVYANKEIKYTVEVNAKTVAKGKGITDDKGNLNISFVNAQPGPINPGIITTSLKPDNNNKDVITQTIPIKATFANSDVQFFPEGGSLVNGINSKIAFKAVSADGLGTAVKGTVTDNENKVVAIFNARHLGMGIFNLAPIAGKTYKANVVFADGSENTINLPVAVDKGYVLSIDNSDTAFVKLKISTSHDMLLTNPDDTLSVLAQSGGEIYYAARSKPGAASFTASVPKNRFPSGIMQFTLFSSKSGAINERLVFIQNPDQIKLDIKADKQMYTPRQKVNLQLNAKNSGLLPVTGSFSVAVVDEAKVPVNEEDESTILSNLLLTSDIKGYVEKPNYYFTHINEQTRADLDVLMLTQGYRRFEWKQILDNNFPAVTYEPEKTLTITGHIKTMGGKPVRHAKVTLVSTKGGMFFLDTLTDEQGKFTFDNLVFQDSLSFVIQGRTGKNGKYVQIDLDNVAPQKITGDKNAPDIQVNINNGLSAYLQSSKNLYNEQLKYGLANHTIVLKEVEIKSKKQPLKHSNNLNGAGNADQVITADQLITGCITLEQCLEGRLLGVVFRNGIPYSTRSMYTPMLVVVDGVYLMSSELNTINMDDIASIEVLRSTAYLSIYGGRGGGGVLLITTKRGDEGYSITRPVPGIIVYSPKGYAKIRTFYSPQYDDPKTNIPVADLRSTIYWNPNIITDKDGNASFQYFNAGGKGTYRVTIEGIDNDGNIGRLVYRYKVE